MGPRGALGLGCIRDSAAVRSPSLTRCRDRARSPTAEPRKPPAAARAQLPTGRRRPTPAVPVEDKQSVALAEPAGAAHRRRGPGPSAEMFLSLWPPRLLWPSASAASLVPTA